MNNLSDYGFALPLPERGLGDGILPARITAVHRERFELITDSGAALGHLKTSEYYEGEQEFPTVGDFVLVDSLLSGGCRIIETLPRRSFFSRLDPSSAGQREQAVAANFDYAIILQSFNRDFNLRRMERYLTLAWQSGAQPVVVLTKADIGGDVAGMAAAAEATAATVPVYTVSAKTGEGLEPLRELLAKGKTAVFLGSSGVGKSSLINALAGMEMMAEGEIRADDSRGRHTTTHRQLIMLPGGAMIIDTPGMRELGMWDVSEGLSRSFADVEEFLGRCRFSDCTHSSEPGCAVRMALESGELSPERWQSYLSLKSEAKYSDDKAAYLKKKQEWHKSISKTNKAAKKHR